MPVAPRGPGWLHDPAAATEAALAQEAELGAAWDRARPSLTADGGAVGWPASAPPDAAAARVFGASAVGRDDCGEDVRYRWVWLVRGVGWLGGRGGAGRAGRQRRRRAFQPPHARPSPRSVPDFSYSKPQTKRT